MLVMINSCYINQQQQWLEALQLLELMHVTSGRQTDKKAKYPALSKGSMSPITLVTAAIRHCTNPDGLRKMSSDKFQCQQEHCQRIYAEPCSLARMQESQVAGSTDVLQFACSLDLT